MKGIKTGYGNATLPFWAVFNLYVIYIITSLPGLAISPIMGDLTKIFPGTSQLETQFLTLGPNIAAIPFVFLGGWIGTRFNNMKLLNWTCLFYGIGGALFFFAPNMLTLIILSFLIGIAAGIVSPLASAFVADLFSGKQRTKQYGYTSAVLNLVLMVCTIATGYLAKISWRLPFLVYLLPLVPLFFAAHFKKYIKEPSDIRKNDAAKLGTPKVKYKFSENVNMPMLIRYCLFYFFITMVIAAISLYVPFRFTNSGTAGDLTSILFLGIMASGFTLNFALKFIKKNVALWVMIFVVAGFALMALCKEAAIVGIGILLASYFYGVAQPYYYDRLSVVSTRVALTLTMAWFAVMDSIGNVAAPFILDGIAKIFHKSTSTDPNIAFQICLVLSVLALVAVALRSLIITIRHKNGKPDLVPAAVPTTAVSINPRPADTPEELAIRSEAEASEAMTEAADAIADARKAEAILKADKEIKAELDAAAKPATLPKNSQSSHNSQKLP